MADLHDLSWAAPVLVHVQTHLADDLGLEQLAGRAGYSPHHFQRRFVEDIGESPHRYVERLRLERAAHLLFVTEDDASVIAESVGYRRYETFTRAFKKRFATGPRSYRVHGQRLDAAEAMVVPITAEGHVSMSAVRIEQRRALPLAFIRVLGDYYAVDPAVFDQLLEWRDHRWPGAAPGVLIGIGHDDPGVTAADDLRFDACVTAPEEFHAENGIGCQPFPAGAYAAITYHGPVGEPMMAAYESVYAYVMASRRYKLRGLPVIEIYNTTRVNAWSSVATTDILVPVVA